MERVENITNDKFLDMFGVDYVFIKDTQAKTYSQMVYGDKKQLQDYIGKHELGKLLDMIEIEE